MCIIPALSPPRSSSPESNFEFSSFRLGLKGGKIRWRVDGFIPKTALTDTRLRSEYAYVSEC